MNILLLLSAALAGSTQAPNPDLAAAEAAWFACLQGQMPRVTAGQTPEAAAKQLMSGCRGQQHRMLRIREGVVMRSDLSAADRAKMLDAVQTEDSLLTFVIAKLREAAPAAP